MMHKDGDDIPWSPVIDLGEQVIFYCQQGLRLESDPEKTEVVMKCVYDDVDDDLVVEGSPEERGLDWDKCVDGRSECCFTWRVKNMIEIFLLYPQMFAAVPYLTTRMSTSGSIGVYVRCLIGEYI